jgi:Zn-dependent protease/CBS domain-containing protein
VFAPPVAAALEGVKHVKQSWTLLRVAGIDVRVHVTFLLLLAWFALVGWAEEGSPTGALRGVLLIVLVFTCVVLHEFGHALMARRFGVRTRDITLLPIGGMARLQESPRTPGAEIAIALAGPGVNLIIVLVLLLAVGREALQPGVEALAQGETTLLQKLAAINVMLAVFNLIPAFPMDGGRVLRAMLALHLPQLRATEVAARVGKLIAVLFVLVGVLYLPMLALIGVFVWFGATLEAADAQMREAVADVALEDALITDFRALDVHATLGQAAALTLAGMQKDFPVVDDGRLVGLLTQTAMLEALRRHGDGAQVARIMKRDIAVARSDESLRTIWQRLREGDGHLLPIVDDGRLVGLIDLDNLVELARIRAAIAGRRG